jgi:hypothetical protein
MRWAAAARSLMRRDGCTASQPKVYSAIRLLLPFSV